MTCHTCEHALMRSVAPKEDAQGNPKIWNYECCERGHWFLPSAPEGHHDCRDWKPGKAKTPQGMTYMMGEDIEL